MGMYVNGESRSGSWTDGNGNSSPPANTETMKIANDRGSHFDGLIDEARIYSRALSQSEIEEHSNNPPNTPSKPDGPTEFASGISQEYSTYGTDPDGNQIRYYFDWGDGTGTWTSWVSSGSSASASHSWSSSGTYYIKTKSQDEWGAESGWSDSLMVLVDDDTSAREVGVWWGEDYCWPNEDLPWSQEDAEGFLNELVSVGFLGIYNFGDDSARKKHFEKPDHWVSNDGSYGEDYNYVDSLDFAWWTGHGSPGKLWLTEDPLFWPRTVDESEVEWGDIDLEWAILCGCEILHGSECTESEWGNAFNRLHGLCGFHTTSYNVPNRGSTFVKYATGQYWPYESLTIKEAWKKTTQDTQPEGVWGSIYAGAHTGGTELAYEYLPGYETGMFPDPNYNDPDWYKINYQWSV